MNQGIANNPLLYHPTSGNLLWMVEILHHQAGMVETQTKSWHVYHHNWDISQPAYHMGMGQAYEITIWGITIH